MAAREISKKLLLQELNELRKKNEELENLYYSVQKQVEEKFKLGNTHFHNMADFLPQIIYETDLNGKLTYSNQCAFSSFGYSQDDIDKGFNIIQSLIPEDRQKAREEIPHVLAGEVSHGKEYTALRKDGTTFPVLIYSAPIIMNGKLTGMRGLLVDITERKKTEEALKYSLSLLTATLESTADGILVVDRKGKIARWNQKFADMWKIPEEVLSNSDDEETINLILTQLSNPDQFVTKVKKLYEHPEESSFDQIKFKDGRIFERYSQPQRVEHNFVGRVWSFRDITEHKRVEKKLRESEERFKNLSSITTEGIMIHDGGVILEANKAFADLLGFDDPETLIGKKGMEVITFTLESEQRIREHLLSGSNETYDVEMIDRKGNIIPAETNGNDITYNGRNARIIRIRNITARKRIELMLRIQHELLLYLNSCSDLQQGLDKVLMTVLQLECIDCGGVYIVDSAENSFEMVVHHGLSTEFAAHISHYPADSPQVKMAFAGKATYGEYGEIFQNTDEVREKEGLRAFATIPIMSQGRLIAVLNLASHIHYSIPTDTRDALEMIAFQIGGTLLRFKTLVSLQESELKYRTLVDNAEEAILVLQDGMLKFFNRRAMELTGYSEREFTIKSFHEFVHPDDRTMVIENYKKRLQGEPVKSRYTFRILTKEGLIKWAETGSVLIKWKGKPASLNFLTDITERKRVEEALQDSELKYRTLVDNADEAILVVQDGLLKFVNRITIALLEGYSEQEIINRPFTEFIHEDDRSMVVENYRRRIANEAVKPRYAFRVVSNDGIVKWMEINATLFEWQGKPATLNFLTNITDRKQAEMKLENERILLKTILDNIPVAVYAKDVDGRKVLANSTDLNSINKPEREVIGHTDMEFLPKEVADMTMADDFSVIKNGERLINREELIITNTGERHWLLTSKIPWHNMEGKIVGLVGIGHDITEHKRAEDVLREKEQRYRTIVENVNDALYIHDFNGNILDLNENACIMLGYTRDELLGTNLKKIDTEENTGALPERMGRLLTEDSILFEGSHARKDGTIIPVEVSGKVVSREGNGIIQGFVRDISERKQTEEARAKLEAKLLQAQKMESVGRLAGGVAHDFNNMLSIILGNVEIALMSLDHSDPLRKGLEEIQDASQRSADLTRQLLAFARKQAITPKVLNINDTIEGMLKMLRRLIGEDIELIWKPGHDLWMVKMDPSQIDQILANLSVNARDAINGIGNLTIETENVILDAIYCADHPGFVPGEYVMLALTDNGCGMDANTLEQIFDPFFTTKEVGKGTGLGLATVYGIIKQNNGFINLDSEPGNGTTFNIYLPRVQTEATESTGTIHKQPSRGTETVLLAEDEVTILKLGKTILEHYGYNVLAASTPKQLLTLVEKHDGPIHLLVTDVVMPGLNGRDLRDKLVVSWPEIKTLFISGYTSDIISHLGVIEEGVHFLEKPFSFNTLATKVREVLDQ